VDGSPDPFAAAAHVTPQGRCTSLVRSEDAAAPLCASLRRSVPGAPGQGLPRLPALTPDEAEFRATRLATEAWQTTSNTAKRKELRAQVGELCREHDLTSDLFDGTDRWGILGDDNQTRLRPVADDDLPAWQRTEPAGDAAGGSSSRQSRRPREGR
jgi:hypothetical protein